MNLIFSIKVKILSQTLHLHLTLGTDWLIISPPWHPVDLLCFMSQRQSPKNQSAWLAQQNSVWVLFIPTEAPSYPCVFTPEPPRSQQLSVGVCPSTLPSPSETTFSNAPCYAFECEFIFQLEAQLNLGGLKPFSTVPVNMSVIGQKNTDAILINYSCLLIGGTAVRVCVFSLFNTIKQHY